MPSRVSRRISLFHGAIALDCWRNSFFLPHATFFRWCNFVSRRNVFPRWNVPIRLKYALTSSRRTNDAARTIQPHVGPGGSCAVVGPEQKRLAVDSPTWRRSMRSSPPGDISHSSRHAITRSKPPPPRDAARRRCGAQKATFQTAFLGGISYVLATVYRQSSIFRGRPIRRLTAGNHAKTYECNRGDPWKRNTTASKWLSGLLSLSDLIRYHWLRERRKR